MKIQHWWFYEKVMDGQNLKDVKGAELRPSKIELVPPDDVDFTYWERALIPLQYELDIMLEKSNALVELVYYLHIYHKYRCSEHFHVNNLITAANKWDFFKEIRSLNTHLKNTSYEVQGIKPKYYRVVCEALKITKGGGSRLLTYRGY